MKNFFNNSSLGLLLFRLFVGLAMAFAHGLSKVPPSEQFVSGVSEMGLPLPYLFAWAAGLSELIGGLLIASGLFTRYASLFLGLTMAVAAFVRHADDPFKMKELALMYLFSCILLLFTGAGRYSLDHKIRKV